jgi:hypothetical protein
VFSKNNLKRAGGNGCFNVFTSLAYHSVQCELGQHVVIVRSLHSSALSDLSRNSFLCIFLMCLDFSSNLRLIYKHICYIKMKIEQTHP